MFQFLLCVNLNKYLISCVVFGFKRRKGFCPGDDQTTGSEVDLLQCSINCLKDSTCVAFRYNYCNDNTGCKLLTSSCKQTTTVDSNNNIYVYDQCKYHMMILLKLLKNWLETRGFDLISTRFIHTQLFSMNAKYRLKVAAARKTAAVCRIEH